MTNIMESGAQIGQRMERPIQIRRTVDQQESFHGIKAMTAKDKVPYPLAPELMEKTWTARESFRVLGIMSEFVQAPEKLAAIRPAVSFFGISGLAALMAVWEATVTAGVEFVVVARTRAVLRPLRLTGLDRKFDVVPTRLRNDESGHR